MSKQSLDEKLVELVAILRGEGAVSSNEEAVKELAASFGITTNMTPVEERVAQIKQAFADEGYVQIPVEAEWVDDDKGTHLEVRGVRVMTGPEWYHRFWSEYETDLPKVIDATIIREQVDKVVRRAAGLQETEE